MRAASTCAPPAGRDVRIVLRDVVSFEILNVQTYSLKHRNASRNGARRAPYVFGFRFLTVIVETVDKLKRSLHLAVSSDTARFAAEASGRAVMLSATFH